MNGDVCLSIVEAVIATDAMRHQNKNQLNRRSFDSGVITYL